MTEQKAYKTLPGINQENIKPLFESYYDSSKCNQNDLDFFTVGYRFGLRDTNQALLEACEEVIEIWKSSDNRIDLMAKFYNALFKLESAITKARGEDE